MEDRLFERIPARRIGALGDAAGLQSIVTSPAHAADVLRPLVSDCVFHPVRRISISRWRGWSADTRLMKFARGDRAVFSRSCRANVRPTAMPVPSTGATRACWSAGSRGPVAIAYATSRGSRIFDVVPRVPRLDALDLDTNRVVQERHRRKVIHGFDDVHQPVQVVGCRDGTPCGR